MKRILLAAMLLLFYTNAHAVDISSLPAFGTPGTTSDKVVMGDMSEAAGSRITGAALTGNAADCFNGQGVMAGQFTDLGGYISDNVNNMSVGTNKEEFRVLRDMTATNVICYVHTAPTGSAAIFDVNKNGTSILSTKVSIDAGDYTSSASSTPPVLSTTTLYEGDRITWDIDQVGSTVPGKGPVCVILGGAD